MTYHLEAMQAAVLLSRRIKAADEFGGLHIVVSDGNIEDEHLEYCLSQTETPLTAEERELADDLLFRQEEIRELAYWLSGAPEDFVDDLERRLSSDPGIPVYATTEGPKETFEGKRK